MPPLLNTSAATFEKSLPPLLTPLYNTQVGTWQIVSDGQYSCGSSGASDIQLKFPDIASEHCRFVFEKLSFLLVRLKGRVWVNEIPVASKIPLRQGDVISLGAFSFRVDVADPLAPAVTKGARHPQILGHVDSPNIQFVGHSDQHFTDVFPRNSAQNHRYSDAINSELQEQRELILRREKEVLRQEEAAQKTERQMRRFLTELETMRSELSTEQWQLKNNRQSLASEREQLQQQWQQQRIE
ncbi:MAG: FHA domain-containing protein, partial [Planctomycetia bacterium]